MSAVGLPGLNGFVGEFLVLVGTFLTHRWWAVVATTGIITGAIYMLWAYQRIFQGKATGANAAVRDISVRELAAIAPLLAGIVFLGIYPKPFLDRVTPAVGHLVNHIEASDPGLHVPRSGQPGQLYAVPAGQVVDSPASLARVAAVEGVSGLTNRLVVHARPSARTPSVRTAAVVSGTAARPTGGQP
jgi:formate hydrogenlyase subunit 3/multisubunit Na+/H+ antiporter MnhD subunit